MTDAKDDDLDLDAFFAAARGQSADPSGDLMDRVLCDALAVQADQQADIAIATDTPLAHPTLWQRILDGVGGWPAMAGLVSAGVAGIWIGANPPDLLATTAESYLNIGTDLYLVDALPGLQLDEG